MRLSLTLIVALVLSAVGVQARYLQDRYRTRPG